MMPTWSIQVHISAPKQKYDTETFSEETLKATLDEVLISQQPKTPFLKTCGALSVKEI